MAGHSRETSSGCEIGTRVVPCEIPSFYLLGGHYAALYFLVSSDRPFLIGCIEPLQSMHERKAALSKIDHEPF
jgi:hypothetical protein